MRAGGVLATAILACSVAASPAVAADNGPIAFQDDTSAGVEGFRVDPDGGGRRVLTDAIDGAQGVPRFSPDGSRILWEDGQVITDPEGLGPRPIPLPSSQARWSPDGGRIVTSGLRIVDADGGGTTPIGNSADHEPEWSPDGTRLVFVGSTGQVTVIGADGAGRTPITNEPAATVLLEEPSFSPDGSRIAFLRSDDESTSVVVANSDGSGAHAVAEANGGQAPEWSPDGRRILFGIADRGDFRLATVAAGGGTPRLITPGGEQEGFVLEEADEASWSPDGSRIVFRYLVSDEQDTRQIATVGADGSGLTPVAEGEDPPFPSWGRTGERVPAVFIPGILGSEIWCDPAARSERLWPALGVDEEKLLLAADGETNASAACPDAGVAEPRYTDPGHLLGPGDSGLAESLFGVDIYGSALARLEETVGAQDLYAFPWDWRRDTGFSLARLDAVVDQAIEETGAERVQLVAHSYGGLLALHYARDPAHRAKLARVTSVGSPYLGSPKSAFPLLTGTELPFSSGLAVAFGGQDDLRRAATTMRGCSTSGRRPRSVASSPWGASSTTTGSRPRSPRREACRTSGVPRRRGMRARTTRSRSATCRGGWSCRAACRRSAAC
jgi:pimeloyl-ACP methyl ester carboxylesterase